MKKQFGFTISELLITLAIASVIFLLAVPSFKHLRQLQHIRYITNALEQSLSYARLQAVLRYQTILISPKDANWKHGWDIEIKKNHQILILRSFSEMPLDITFSSGHENIKIMTNGMTEGHQCHFAYGDVKLVLNRGGRTYLEKIKS